MKIKILSVVIIIFMCMLVVTGLWVPALAQTSGTYGDNIIWNFSDGVLTFSGTGEMYNSAWDYTRFYESGLNIEKIVLEEGITTVDSLVFSNIKTLKEVILPSTVYKIGFSSFWNCENLNTVNLPPSLTEIESFAFASSGVRNLVIPDGVTYISPNAFEHCNYLNSVKFEGNITRIDDYAFSSCHSLKEVEFSKTVSEFGDFSFANCNNLNKIKIPEGTKTLGNYAFYDCYTSIEIPSSVNHIGEKCFDHYSRYFVSKENENYAVQDGCLINKKTNEMIITKTDFGGILDGPIPETLIVPDGVEIIVPDAIGASPQYICVLPGTVKQIGANNFLPDDFWKVIYNGDDFSNIKITPSGNEGLLNCNIVNSQGEKIQNPVFKKSYSFVSNGGTPVEDIYSETVETCPVTTRFEYDFVGWSTDPESSPGNEVTFPYSGEDTVLYAVWEKTNKKIVALQIDNNIARINGQNIVLDAAPQIVNSRTMLPIRAVAEGLGAEVQWHDDARRVVVFGEYDTIIIYIGNDVAYVNNEPIKIDTVPFIENNRTYLPLRFVCETLGADVEWIEETREIIITGQAE